MITGQENMDRAVKIGITKTHFQGILWPNYCLLDFGKMEIADYSQSNRPREQLATTKRRSYDRRSRDPGSNFSSWNGKTSLPGTTESRRSRNGFRSDGNCQQCI